jgi:hypothetical protein
LNVGADADDGRAPIAHPVAGVLLVQGDAESLLRRFINRVLQVFVRESGF